MQKKIKRAFDISISLIGLIILLPLMIIIYFLIKIETKGNGFFLQDRLGENGKVFKIFKFRTMVQNAEKIGSGIYTNETDSRITKVGNFLRKTSLDELPQLINVLKGDMSIVGPRPPVTYHPYKFEDYPSEKKRRFDVKPGITGLAQVTGRNSLSWDERIEIDIKYVENMSFYYDLKIILMTVLSVLKKESIYRG